MKEIEKRIEKCVEKYKKLVAEIQDLEFEHDIYVGRMDNYKDLLSKEDLTPGEFRLLVMYKSLKVDDDIVLRMLQNKKEKLEDKKPYFEVGAIDILGALQKMTGGEIVARKLDDECKIGHNDLGIANVDFVYDNTYEFGVKVDENEIMLPKIAETYYEDINANEVMPSVSYNLVDDGLIGSKDKTFSKPEYQEMFWELFKEKLSGLAEESEKNSIRRQLDEMKNFENILDEITR